MTLARRMVDGSVVEALALACARPASPDRDASVADIASQPGLDWAAAVTLAGRHHLLPRTARGLELAGVWDALPADLADFLRTAYLQTMAQNLLLSAELEKLLLALAAAKIEVMALKGAAWVPVVYDDWGLRPVGDLDLLLHPEDLPTADAIIQDLGYAAGPPIEGHHHWPALVRGDGLVSVELHHHLGPRGTLLDFELDGMWARARPAKRGTADVLVPSPEDLVVHVALHFLGDRTFPCRGGALAQLADLAAILDRLGPTLDWQRIAEEAHRHQVGPPLVLALAAVDRLLEAATPPEAMRALAPHGVDGQLVEQFARHAVTRTPAWLALEELSGRFPSVRQLLPPNPARWATTRRAARPPFGLVEAYARWAAAAGRVLGHPRGIRDHVRLDRALRAMFAASARCRG